jgi:predicted metalloprotease
MYLGRAPGTLQIDSDGRTRMRLRSAGLLAVLALLTLVLNPARQDPGSAVRLVARSGPIALSSSATCPVQGDYEGQFTDSSQMGVFMECVLPGVEDWIDATYERMPPPRAYYFVPSGVQGQDEAGCPFNSMALQYCPGSGNIFLGQDSVWEQYARYGDAAPVIILAHEMTHHLQRVGQMTPAQVPNEQIRYENQADCGAGAFMNYAREQGWMNVDDDLQDLPGSLIAASESEGPDQMHGTIQERLQSFDRGYASVSRPPMLDCNAFVPERAILSA